jgi:hypothetical protein
MHASQRENNVAVVEGFRSIADARSIQACQAPGSWKVLVKHILFCSLPCILAVRGSS